MGKTQGKPIWVGLGRSDRKPICHWRIDEDAIRTRAYFLSLENGGQQPDLDWQQAENEYWAEAGLLQKNRRLPMGPAGVF